jgi:hypothetical protein
LFSSPAAARLGDRSAQAWVHRFVKYFTPGTKSSFLSCRLGWREVYYREVSLSVWAKKNGFLTAALLVWVPAVAYGFSILLQYSNTPGVAEATPIVWPHGAMVALNGKGSTLMLFAHPQCPCSRASLGELARILALAGNRLDANVFFYSSPHEPESWVQSDLWKQADEIPGVRVHMDPGGRIARGFGARTSGHTLLYDPQGRLKFTGGITAARGHSGDNAGRDAIVALLRGEAASLGTLPAKTKVFGCSL